VPAGVGKLEVVRKARQSIYSRVTTFQLGLNPSDHSIKLITVSRIKQLEMLLFEAAELY